MSIRFLLAAFAIGASACAHGEGPTDAEADAFLSKWLGEHGYAPPTFEVSAAGMPDGAHAATFCNANATRCVIRVRPEALRSPVADRRAHRSHSRQWQNLLAHEGAHYIDILRRGTSDHGPKFGQLARELGVAYPKR